MNRPTRAGRHPAAWLLPALVGCVLAVGPPASAQDSEWDRCAKKCHEDYLVEHYETTVHGRLGEHEVPWALDGCAACHGDGERHMKTEEAADIIGLVDANSDEIAAVCNKCHAGGHFAGWYGSEHQLSGVGCLDCHSVHPSDDLRQWPASDPRTCYQCHRDVETQVRMPSHHPIMEGKLTCQSCHEPHGGYPGGLRTEERPNNLCLDCHAALQGPFVFEHPPVVEDCSICHSAHGSVANNLLLQNEPFLCLQCHEFHFHSAQLADDELEATDAFSAWPEQPTFGNPFGSAGYKVAFTTKCSQCHSHVHGSDLPSQSTAGQGGAYTR